MNAQKQTKGTEIKTTVVDYKEKMLQGVDSYLKDKYPSIDYQVMGVIPCGGIGGALYDLANVYVTGGDNEADSFYIKRYKDGEGYRYVDTYFGLLIREDFEKIVLRISKNYFKTYKVRVSFIEPFDNSMVEGTSLDKFIELYQNKNRFEFIDLYTEDTDSLFENNAKSFSVEMRKQNFTNLFIYLLDNGKVEELTREKMIAIAKNEDYIKRINPK